MKETELTILVIAGVVIAIIALIAFGVQHNTVIKLNNHIKDLNRDIQDKDQSIRLLSRYEDRCNKVLVENIELKKTITSLQHELASLKYNSQAIGRANRTKHKPEVRDIKPAGRPTQMRNRSSNYNHRDDSDLILASVMAESMVDTTSVHTESYSRESYRSEPVHVETRSYEPSTSSCSSSDSGSSCD